MMFNKLFHIVLKLHWFDDKIPEHLKLMVEKVVELCFTSALCNCGVLTRVTDPDPVGSSLFGSPSPGSLVLKKTCNSNFSLNIV